MFHSDFTPLAGTGSITPYFKHNTNNKPEGFPSHKQKYKVNCQGNIDTFTTHELVRF